MARKRKAKSTVLAKAETERVDDTTANDVKAYPASVNPASRTKQTAASLGPVSKAKAEPLASLIDDLLPAEPSMQHLSTARVILVGTTLLGVGTLGFYYIPGLIRKHGDSSGNHLIDAFYCAAITLTTVGFGDICPGEATLGGKLFLLIFAFAGLGMFCGPIVQLGAAWRHAIPGGLPALGTFVLGLGVTIFTTLEGLDHFEAIYASIITGTTIGYGDITPQTDFGKVAVALYAIVSVHAVGILLNPAREYLEQLCRPLPKKKRVHVKKNTSAKDD